MTALQERKERQRRWEEVQRRLSAAEAQISLLFHQQEKDRARIKELELPPLKVLDNWLTIPPKTSAIRARGVPPSEVFTTEPINFNIVREGG